MNNEKHFGSFIVSYISLSVIAGLFTYRLLNSFLDNILLPFLDITILPDKHFHKLTKVYNNHKKEIDPILEEDKYQYIFKPGLFLKELIIWSFLIMILFLIYKFTNK
jgi:large-conductance mechanosensitive channel